jgi:hypothetical protein
MVELVGKIFLGLSLLLNEGVPLIEQAWPNTPAPAPTHPSFYWTTTCERAVEAVAPTAEANDAR